MARHEICRRNDLPEGERRIIQINERLSVGVFNIEGQILAYRNECPHAGAPVCVGALSGAIVSDGLFERHLAFEGRILRCPWHAWEFQLPEGTTLTQPPFRLKSYPVSLVDDTIFVEVDVPPKPAEKEQLA